MRSLHIIFVQPDVQIHLQLINRMVQFTPERNLIKLLSQLPQYQTVLYRPGIKRMQSCITFPAASAMRFPVNGDHLARNFFPQAPGSSIRH